MPTIPWVWTVERIAALRNFHALRLTHDMMAAQLGVSSRSVRSQLSRMGLMYRKPQWDKRAVALLRQRHAEGVPFSAIAEEIGNGMTKNACIGKARRLGLPDRVQGKHPFPRSPHRPKPRARQMTVQRKIPSAPAQAPPSRNIALMDLGNGFCRWPVTEYPPHLFCGNSTVIEESYCPYHHWLAHNRSHDRELAMGPGPKGTPNWNVPRRHGGALTNPLVK